MKLNLDVFLLVVCCVFLMVWSSANGAKPKKRKKTPTREPPPDDACDLRCGRGAKLNTQSCRCVCQKGYKYDEYYERCNDVDECRENEGKCQGTCYNSVGSFECRCGVGYILHADGWQCLPEPRFAPCQALACYDGAFLKVRKCECRCPSGLWYDFIAEKCQDINECKQEDNECEHCMNYYGGSSCYCPKGFELNNDGVTCERTDFTIGAELACNAMQCGEGAMLDLVYCECICQDGFYYDDTNEVCQDENECIYDPCEGDCIETPGSYRCVCPNRITADSEGRCVTPTYDRDALICDSHEKMCADGSACFFESTLCDGHPDCADSSDESECKQFCYPQQFACANGENCLDDWLTCNGDNDCGDNSDEIDCDCMDYSPKCPGWSIRDECVTNPAYMNMTCRESCGLCLVGYETESGTVTMTENPELYFLRHSEKIAKSTQYILRNVGRRPGRADNTWQCATVTDVPQQVREDMGLSTFYEKYTHAYNIPVLGSARVSDDALKRACYVTRVMLSDNRRVRQSMFYRYARIVVIADTEVILNIPEYSHLPSEYSDLVRGLGGTHHLPVISVGQENLLCEKKDPNKKEDTLVRALAQGIHRIALMPNDLARKFQHELEETYAHARTHGMWERTVTDDTLESYFSEGVQSFFNVQAAAKAGLQNDVDTREKLKYYDPKLFAMLADVFPCQNKMIDRCSKQSKIETGMVRLNCDVPITANSDGVVPQYDPSCVDIHESCERWTESGECSSNPGWMLLNCPVSCDNCEIINDPEPPVTVEDENCVDLNEHCESWAGRGECEANPAYMRPNCGRSCNACGQDPNCFDNNDSCSIWAESGHCESNLGYMGIYCQSSCNLC